MCGVFFKVRTEFLNNIYTRFSFKGLMENIDKNDAWLRKMVYQRRGMWHTNENYYLKHILIASAVSRTR
jgi:hypothetical protein